MSNTANNQSPKTKTMFCEFKFWIWNLDIGIGYWDLLGFEILKQ